MNMHKPEGERDITTEEAARELDIAPRTVTAYVQRGLIAAKKVAGTYFIEPIELARYKTVRRRAGRPPKE